MVSVIQRNYAPKESEHKFLKDLEGYWRCVRVKNVVELIEDLHEQFPEADFKDYMSNKPFFFRVKFNEIDEDKFINKY